MIGGIHVARVLLMHSFCEHRLLIPYTRLKSDPRRNLAWFDLGIGGLKRRGQQPAHPLPLLVVVLIQPKINRTPVLAEPECSPYPIPEREDDGIIAVGLGARARVMQAMNGR